MNEVESFIDFLGGILKKGISTSAQQLTFHAATRDTLQRFHDQLPGYYASYQKSQETPVLDSSALESTKEEA